MLKKKSGWPVGEGSTTITIQYKYGPAGTTTRKVEWLLDGVESAQYIRLADSDPRELVPFISLNGSMIITEVVYSSQPRKF
jgi:hypothetical protein